MSDPARSLPPVPRVFSPRNIHPHSKVHGRESRRRPSEAILAAPIRRSMQDAGYGLPRI
jgi:hypothetical protein